MLNKKCIVLSDTQEGSSKKAVLTLQEQAEGICGTLRLYNFPREVDGICSLGIYENKRVHKAGLTQKSHMLYEFFVNLKQIPQKFSVAVVNFQNAVASPILFGSSDGCENNIYAQIISDVSGGAATVKNVTETLDKFGVDFADKEKSEIEAEIDKAMCENDCANCIYKKFFFENQPAPEGVKVGAREVEEQPQKTNVFSENEVFVNAYSEEKEEKTVEIPNYSNEKQQEDKQDLFFNRLKPQIDKLFADHPAEDNLQQLIPSSKWVKVDFEDEGDFYVFGLLYDEEDQVKYVCYGVPAVFDQQPPKELSGYPVWLPLGQKEGFGYWLTYQDAATGEPVKAILD